MAERKNKGSLGPYTTKISITLTNLFVDLLKYGRLDTFPHTDGLETALDKMDYAVKYIDEIPKYRPEIEKFEKVLEYVDKFIDEIKKYTREGFGKNWHEKNRIIYDLDDVCTMEHDVDRVKELLEAYKPNASPEEMPKKTKAAEKALVIIAVVIGLGFGLLRLFSAAQVGSATGFFIAPTSEFAGINFEMLYVITSSMIIGIYVLGKLMKKW
jgi:hypothetical protein